MWEKRLFSAASVPAILHIRREESPWGRYTVWWRDWLREHPAEHDRYERVKRALSEQNGGKADCDDDTRAKTASFDDVQREPTAWATGCWPSDDLRKPRGGTGRENDETTSTTKPCTP